MWSREVVNDDLAVVVDVCVVELDNGGNLLLVAGIWIYFPKGLCLIMGN